MKPVEEMDTAELWCWLRDHPKYNLPHGDCENFWQALPMALDIEFVHVDPTTLTIEDDESRNTKVECWLEMGTIYFPEIYGSDEDGDMKFDTEPRASHDIYLDTGGDDFESAFKALCLKVLDQDGDYER
jgi:hypothetical protein